MCQCTPTPDEGTPRIAPHYRLTEPLENRLNDARCLLAIVGDLVNVAPDGSNVTLGTADLAAVARIIRDLLPDSRQMAYVPQQFLED